MEIETTSLSGVVILTPRRFGDDRGHFSETYNLRTLEGLGIATAFVQDNQSLSRPVNTIRGLHYQRPPHAQAKLVRVLAGRIFDVAVDVRKGSPTWGQWVGVELSADDGRQLLIPAGFLHGFVTREPDTVVFYKCSDTYAPDCDGGVRWDDPAIGIDWGLTGEPVLSAKDKVAPLLSEFDSPFTMETA